MCKAELTAKMQPKAILIMLMIVQYVAAFHYRLALVEMGHDCACVYVYDVFFVRDVTWPETVIWKRHLR